MQVLKSSSAVQCPLTKKQRYRWQGTAISSVQKISRVAAAAWIDVLCPSKVFDHSHKKNKPFFQRLEFFLSLSLSLVLILLLRKIFINYVTFPNLLPLQGSVL